MLIPLWLPWTVVALFLVAAVFRPPYAGTREQERQAHQQLTLRAWALAAVVAVVASVLTWDRVQVSEDELHDAVEDAVALSAGGARFSPEEIEVLVRDRLGRDVALQSQSQTDEERDGDVTRYEVQVRQGLGEAYDGSRACLEAYTGESWYADVDEGGCDEQ